MRLNTSFGTDCGCERKYFSLGGCAGPEMRLLREYFSLEGCAGPGIENISLWKGVLVLE